MDNNNRKFLHVLLKSKKPIYLYWTMYWIHLLLSTNTEAKVASCNTTCIYHNMYSDINFMGCAIYNANDIAIINFIIIDHK